ncbi:glycosyltransferase [Leifsonia kafniensis]|uniref:Glycosyltransferase n=1 Tax=Leifsonia kafniensis TaxID=475957 RepID=A0ABP7LAW2_9MICO
MSSSAANPKAPASATLIMTLLNEASGIETFLQSLTTQTVLPSEIVIVDGGSTDSTLSILRAWQPPSGVTLVLEELPGAGISQGRNRAIELASFEKILVTDAGTQVNSDWVEKILAGLESAEVASGFFEPLAGTFFSTLIAAVITPTITEIDPEKFLPSSRSIGFSTKAWRRGGKYPEWLDYCEDLIFDIAMRDAGVTFRFVPDAIVRWEGRPSFTAFAKQYYRYARGDGKAQLWARRHAIRYGAYLGGLALVVLALVASPFWWIALGAGFFIYMSQPFRRVLFFRNTVGAAWPGAILLAPFVVVLGDVSKMLGYPAGLVWRRKNRLVASASIANVAD